MTHSISQRSINPISGLAKTSRVNQFSSFAVLFIILVVCLANWSQPLSAATLNVFAAASLTDSLREIAKVYEAKTGDKLVFNFGASSVLARQIEEGAPADLFFSADEARMDALTRRNLVIRETRTSRLSNSLVIVVPTENGIVIRSPKDLAEARVTRLALADPKTVPAGIYAKEYLEKNHLWPAVEKKVIPTDNVRAALSAVESGNVEAGIVYKTDAGISKKVKVAYEVPIKDGPTISYPMAVTTAARDLGAARRLLTFLNSDAVEPIFKKFGFIVRH